MSPFGVDANGFFSHTLYELNDVGKVVYGGMGEVDSQQSDREVIHSLQHGFIQRSGAYGTENFFVDPWGEIMPCNGLDKSIWMESMGNLNDNSFEDIWNGEMAKIIRDKVRTCPKNCWMIGTASPVMKKYISKPVGWIIKRKLFGIHG